MNYELTKEKISNGIQKFISTYTYETKLVIKYNALGFFEKEYSSAKECAFEEKIKLQTICKSCRSNRASVFGH